MSTGLGFSRSRLRQDFQMVCCRLVPEYSALSPGHCQERPTRHHLDGIELGEYYGWWFWWCCRLRWSWGSEIAQSMVFGEGEQDRLISLRDDSLITSIRSQFSSLCWWCWWRRVEIEVMSVSMWSSLTVCIVVCYLLVTSCWGYDPGSPGRMATYSQMSSPLQNIVSTSGLNWVESQPLLSTNIYRGQETAQELQQDMFKHTMLQGNTAINTIAVRSTLHTYLPQQELSLLPQ